MEDNLTKSEIKLTIENALLHNNKQLTDEFEKTVEKQMDKLTAGLNKQTDSLLEQFIKIVQRQETQQGEILSLQTNQRVQKRTMGISLGAAVIVLGVLQFLITQSLAGK